MYDLTCADQALPWTSRGSPEFDFWILTFEEDLGTWTFSVYIICFWWSADSSPWSVFLVQFYLQPNSLLLLGQQAGFLGSKNQSGFDDDEDFQSPLLYTEPSSLHTLCCILYHPIPDHNILSRPWKNCAHMLWVKFYDTKKLNQQGLGHAFRKI